MSGKQTMHDMFKLSEWWHHIVLNQSWMIKVFIDEIYNDKWEKKRGMGDKNT